MSGSSSTAEKRLFAFIDENSDTWADSCSSQLLDLAQDLQVNKPLLRTFTDNGLDPSVRTAVAHDLLGSSLGAPALRVIEFAAGLRWGTPNDLVRGLASAGIRASLAEAERRGDLDQIEDEIFRFTRIVAANGELELALSDPAISASARDGLLDELLGSRMAGAGLAAVKYVLNNRGGRSVNDSLNELVAMAASRRGKLLAEVTSAVALDSNQKAKLVKTLESIYGRNISLQNEIDPSVIGGISVRVGDDLIDGTVAESLEQARRRMTQGV